MNLGTLADVLGEPAAILAAAIVAYRAPVAAVQHERRLDRDARRDLRTEEICLEIGAAVEVARSYVKRSEAMAEHNWQLGHGLEAELNVRSERGISLKTSRRLLDPERVHPNSSERHLMRSPGVMLFPDLEAIVDLVDTGMMLLWSAENDSRLLVEELGRAARSDTPVGEEQRELALLMRDQFRQQRDQASDCGKTLGRLLGTLRGKLRGEGMAT